MRELAVEEMQQVNGGITPLEGASMIVSLSLYSPVTLAFGMPIAGALLVVDYLSN
jgi:hypothetical protein